MDTSAKKWDKTWGYSGLVGEWHIEIAGGKKNVLRERFELLIQTLNLILPSLQVLHNLHVAEIDLSILSGEDLEKEKDFIEDLDLEVKSMSELIPKLKEVLSSYKYCLCTSINIELNTIVLEKGKELVLPESAELYIGTESFSDSSTEASLFISYSTFIDVWLDRTLDKDGKERDNFSPSQENQQRLRSFLKDLDEHFTTEIERGESRYYGRYINKYGF